MSSIDERIVKMVFDNSQFEGKVASTITSLTHLNKATDEVADHTNGLSAIGEAFEKTEALATKAGFHIENVWHKVASVFEYQIAGKIVDTGKKIANALTMEGVTDGFKEYELKMGSIQTIMAGTGESLATVNKQLDELNKYSDQTIYSFADMTNNIGKFTNAGVDLKDAVAAIKGIANEAAISGANANEASRAMYNFSQALSAGYVKLIDWKSIENANMATKGFKDTLLEVASAVGTVEKDADGMYKILTTNAQGKTMDDLVSGTKNFNDSLQQQWMTTEVLTQALKIYATNVEDLTDAEKSAYEQELKGLGFDDEQIKYFEDLGTKATKAASEIKTFTMLMDTLKEAIGSGWAMTWQLIIGDFEQAKSLWTEVGNVLSGAIDTMSESRNALIKNGLQTGWERLTTMTGAAIPEAEKFRDVLLDVGKSHKALTEEQIKEIDSTEKLVDSFHNLGWVTGPMITEAIDTYYDSLVKMTDAERKEMGITEADIYGLKQLQEMFKNGSLDAEDFAKSMNNLGGRENIIEGMRNAFRGLIAVLTPIKDAFREIFPPATADQLYNLTVRFKEFTDSLKVSDELADKLKRTAKGIFAIFDIGKKAIGAFVKAILPVGDGMLSLGDNLLTATADIGDFLVGLDEAITKNQVFEKAFGKLSDIIKKVVSVIQSFSLDDLKQKIQSFFDYIKNSTDEVDGSGILDFFKEAFDDISAGIDNVIEKLGFLKPLGKGIVSVFKGAISIIGEVLQSIGDTISGVSSSGGGVSGLMNIFNALLSGGIMYKLFSNVKTFSNIGELLESVGGAINSFQNRVDSETLMNIAKGVALLAASLFLVAMIDEDKLLGATTAIGTMVGIMAGAMAGLMKAVDAFSTSKVSSTFKIFGKELFGKDATKMIEMAVTLQAVAKALVAMGAAVLMMAVGLRIVSKAAEGGHLWDSFAVVSLMLGELTGVAILLGKYGNEGDRGAKGLITMATSLLLVAVALKMVSKTVESGNAWEALGIVSIILGELTGVVLLISKFAEYQLGGMLSLISMAVALNLVVIALKQVSDALGEEGQHIWQALGIIGIILAALTGVVILMSTFGGFAAVGGLGAIMAAAAVLIIVQALKQVSDELGQQDQHVWQALGVIGAALLVLAVGLTAMIVGIPGAVALVIASAALVILAGALKLLGNLSMAEIGKSLLTLAGSLLILAAGLTLMIAALPGAVALVVAAAGLTVLAGALKLFGGMDLKEIGKGLLALFTSLLGLAVIGTVLSVVSPLILIFGAAIALLGGGLIAVGVGLTFFASGLQALMAVLPLASTALSMLGDVVKDLIVDLAEGLMNALGTIAEKFVEYGPTFTEAILTFLTMILTVISEAAPQIADTFYTVIESLLTVIAEHVPQLAEAGANLMIAFMQAISEQIPRITDEGYKCAIALINGLADTIRNNNVELINAVNNLMDAVIQAIMQWLVEFSPLGLLMDDELKKGILDGETNVITAVEELIKNIIARIKEFASDFTDAATNLIAGFIEGFKSSWAGQALEEASNFASNIVKSFNSKKGLNENSPSKKTRQSGIYFVQGFIDGLKYSELKAINYTKKVGSDLSNALKTSVEEASVAVSDTMEFHPVVSPVFDLTNLRKGAVTANSLLAGRSLDLASNISVGYSPNGSVGSANNETPTTGGNTTFIQNNYSPKALSRVDIYRDTRNMLSQYKQATT